jgi:hypothetical protein
MIRTTYRSYTLAESTVVLVTLLWHRSFCGPGSANNKWGTTSLWAALQLTIRLGCGRNVMEQPNRSLANVHAMDVFG